MAGPASEEGRGAASASSAPWLEDACLRAQEEEGICPQFSFFSTPWGPETREAEVGRSLRAAPSGMGPFWSSPLGALHLTFGCHPCVVWPAGRTALSRPAETPVEPETCVEPAAEQPQRLLTQAGQLRLGSRAGRRVLAGCCPPGSPSFSGSA